jgi:hypothetical protein
MSEENKALARRYLEEIWDKGNVDLLISQNPHIRV